MNIVLFAVEYPSPEDEKYDEITTVVKDFAGSWVTAGHRVVVYHNFTKIPAWMKCVPATFIRFANEKFGYTLMSGKINTARNKQSRRIDSDGVLVRRFPMKRVVPKVGFFKFQVVRQFELVKNDLNELGFIPDIAIGHWEDPQIELLSLMKKEYGVKTVLTLHKVNYLRRSGFRGFNYLGDVDAVFARSETIRRELTEIMPDIPCSGICRSGIEPLFYALRMSRKEDWRNFIYVGRLVPYKNVDTILESLHSFFGDDSYRLTIVGSGSELDALCEVVRNNKQSSKVFFEGKKTREEVASYLKRSSVYVMVSENETFGLSYIEAMASGCIVVASNDGGMRGVIVHGHNGFLCNPGDSHDLERVLREISCLSDERWSRIVRAGMDTARRYSIMSQSQEYLENILDAVREW